MRRWTGERVIYGMVGIVGVEEFAERMLKIGKKVVVRQKGWAYRSAGERRAHGEFEAARILKEGLRAAGLGEEELEELPGSDLRKVALAKLIWERTTVSQSWIAAHLRMNSAANVSQQIKRMKDPVKESPLPKPLKKFLKLSIYEA